MITNCDHVPGRPPKGPGTRGPNFAAGAGDQRICRELRSSRGSEASHSNPDSLTTDRPNPRRRRHDWVAMPLPDLSPEQRAAALEKAAAARKARAELRERLKSKGATVGDVLKQGETDEVIGKMRV